MSLHIKGNVETIILTEAYVLFEVVHTDKGTRDLPLKAGGISSSLNMAFVVKSKSHVD